MYYLGFLLGVLHGVLIGMLIYKYKYLKVPHGQESHIDKRAATEGSRA